MSLTIPGWFDAAHFTKEKVAQMNTTDYDSEWLAQQYGELPEGEKPVWTAELFEKYINEWTDADGAPLGGEEASFADKCWLNFQACNTQDYVEGITIQDINVSATPLFNVPLYLQALADDLNSDPAEAGPPPSGPENSWTAQDVLDVMFGTYKASALAHFNANWPLHPEINPSNDFDVMGYLKARAEAMGEGATVEDAIAAIQEAGMNPIDDFASFGVEHGIEQPIPDVKIVMPEKWDQWGGDGSGAVEPAPEEYIDPYDVDVVDVQITKDVLEYKAEDEVNTRFNAVYASSGESTLSAKDVITGGTGLNTLSVELGKNWTGFNGVKQTESADPDAPAVDQDAILPSVSAVGRVVLKHSEDAAHRDLAFDAKNISEDTVRYDLHASGSGVISLSNLSAGVEQVNIFDLQTPSSGAAMTPSLTSLTFAPGAKDGDDDALTLGLKNVTQGTDAAAPISAEGIEHLTIEGLHDNEMSNVDISAIRGVETLSVTGGGFITITDTANNIKAYDASTATGVVSIGVRGLTDQEVIGNDGLTTIAFRDEAAVRKANWTGVENVAFFEGGQVNAKDVEGLQGMIVNKNGGTLTNLASDAITVIQTESLATGKSAVVNGAQNNLGDLFWEAQTTGEGKDILAKLETSATGDVTIKAGSTALADGSIFTFSKAGGSLNLDIEAGAGTTAGTSIIAPNVLDMTGEITGNFKFGATSNLSSLESIDLTLANSGTADDSFIMSDVALNAIAQIDIDAGGQAVSFGSIGTEGGRGAEINIDNAKSFSAGEIKSGPGGNISAKITADETVTIESIGSTPVEGKTSGNIDLTVNAETMTGLNLFGSQMNLNFEDTDGVGSTDQALVMNATGTILYEGSLGSDWLEITGAGKDSRSTINLSDGEDHVSVHDFGSAATLYVNLGSDQTADELTVAAATGGVVTVYAQGFDGADTDTITLEGDALDDIAAINAIFSAAGLGNVVPQSAGADAFANGVYYSAGTAYAAVGTAEAGAVIVLQGASSVDDINIAAA